nr:MAG TPA: hypothetical protein [Caudoviricetes sp.]
MSYTIASTNCISCRMKFCACPKLSRRLFLRQYPLN